jgi:quercetin dioxygenase-like cupin family protein
MIRRIREVQAERREDMRGGQGPGWARTYVKHGEMDGVAFVTEMALEVGTTIGLHLHDTDEELYVVQHGHGTGLLDDTRFAVGPGDAWLCSRGHRHGVAADQGQALRFWAVLTAPR